MKPEKIPYITSKSPLYAHIYAHIYALVGLSPSHPKMHE